VLTEDISKHDVNSLHFVSNGICFTQLYFLYKQVTVRLTIRQETISNCLNIAVFAHCRKMC